MEISYSKALLVVPFLDLLKRILINPMQFVD